MTAMTYTVRAARPEEYAAVGALTAEAYRADGLLDAHDHPVEDSVRGAAARRRPSRPGGGAVGSGR